MTFSCKLSALDSSIWVCHVCLTAEWTHQSQTSARSGAPARQCVAFHRASIPSFWVSTFMEFLSYFRGKILTFFSYKRRTGRLKDINRGPMGQEQQPTLWLRSVTPADLKSGNLMPAVSGTAWKRSKQDVLMEETKNATLDRDTIWRGNTVSYDRTTCQGHMSEMGGEENPKQTQSEKYWGWRYLWRAQALCLFVLKALLSTKPYTHLMSINPNPKWWYQHTHICTLLSLSNLAPFTDQNSPRLSKPANSLM